MSMPDIAFHKDECEVFSDGRTIISVIEKGRKYIAINNDQNEVTLYRVDKCLITQGIKCDFLLLNHDKKSSFYIELKGKHLLHAIDQIESTISMLHHSIFEFKIHVRIILSRVCAPDLRSNKYKKLENMLRKKGGSIAKKVRELQEDI